MCLGLALLVCYFVDSYKMICCYFVHNYILFSLLNSFLMNHFGLINPFSL
ncbi:hypothetical protein LINPERHAP1_LOCUS30204, partial [Linum perenne]